MQGNIDNTLWFASLFHELFFLVAKIFTAGGDINRQMRRLALKELLWR